MIRTIRESGREFIAAAIGLAMSVAVLRAIL